MTDTDRPTVALFRPDDDRLGTATEMLRELGVEPVGDPMLAIEPTGTQPREDAEYTILTSKTGVELASEAGWTPGGTVCAIGASTARALRDAGYTVDIVPEEYSSEGLVAGLADEVAGSKIEVARSDHGSDILLNGLETAGGYIHETILYRLVRPAEAGRSVERAAEGTLDAALFTSSLTVDYFLEAAAEQGVQEAAIAGLNEAIVGVIGAPTRRTAEEVGIMVDVVPDDADFEALARTAVEQLETS